MKRVSIKEAKDRFTAIARDVEGGARITVTRNGKPILDLVPHQTRGGLDFDALRRWKKERGVASVAGPMAADFDNELPEDFLSTPMD
jgi:antitoxin (DNA-binding transcriptional repressor) of toxin-antitoxin stability system